MRGTRKIQAKRRNFSVAKDYHILRHCQAAGPLSRFATAETFYFQLRGFSYIGGIVAVMGADYPEIQLSNRDVGTRQEAEGPRNSLTNVGLATC